MSDQNKGEQENKGTGEQEKIVADLQKKMDDMGKMLDDAKKANETLREEVQTSKDVWKDPDYLDYLEKRDGKGSSEKAGDEDLDAMSRAEFATYTQKGMQGVMTDMAKKMDEQMDVMGKQLAGLTNMADVEFQKLRSPEFAKIIATDEGRERFLKISDENKSWGAKKIYEDMQKDDIVKDKHEADLKVSQAKEEETVWSEKPGQAASIAEEKDLTDEEIAGKAYDATFGTTPHALEGEQDGVVVA